MYANFRKLKEKTASNALIMRATKKRDSKNVNFQIVATSETKMTNLTRPWSTQQQHKLQSKHNKYIDVDVFFFQY